MLISLFSRNLNLQTCACWDETCEPGAGVGRGRTSAGHPCCDYSPREQAGVVPSDTSWEEGTLVVDTGVPGQGRDLQHSLRAWSQAWSQAWS